MRKTGCAHDLANSSPELPAAIVARVSVKLVVLGLSLASYVFGISRLSTAHSNCRSQAHIVDEKFPPFLVDVM